MKLIALAIVTIVGLAGCAATQTPASFSMETDFAKIQAVNNAARGMGVQVVWVNAPQKLVKVAGT